jgi:hypothetical protein
VRGGFDVGVEVVIGNSSAGSFSVNGARGGIDLKTVHQQ